MTGTPRDPTSRSGAPAADRRVASSPSCSTGCARATATTPRRERAGDAAPADSPQRAWHRLLRAGSPRATRANVLAMVLAGALGFAIIAQVRQTSLEGLENLREDELVRIFAGVDQDGERLADEIRGAAVLARPAQEPVDQRGRGAARRPRAAGGARHPRRHRRRPPAPASSSRSATPTTRSTPRPSSTPCRSCATPAPRRSRSATSGSSPTPGSPTPTRACRCPAREVRPPYVIKAIGDAQHAGRRDGDPRRRHRHRPPRRRRHRRADRGRGRRSTRC